MPVNLERQPRTDLLDTLERARVARQTEAASEEESTQTAALAVGAKFPEVQPDTFDSVRTEVQATGRSSLVDDLLRRGETRNQEDLRQATEELITQPGVQPQEAQQILRAATTQATDTSLKEEFKLNVAQQSETPTKNREEIQNSYLDYLLFRRQHPEAIQRMIAESGINFNPDNALLDVTTSLALPGYGLALFGVLDEAIPGFAGGSDVVLAGSMVERFKESLLDMSIEEQKNVFRRIIKAVEKSEFYGRDNGAVKRDILVSLLSDLKPSNTEEILLNAVSILDLFALGEFVRIGGAAFKGVKGAAQLARKGELANTILNNLRVRKSPTSVSSQLDQADPERSRQLAEDALLGRPNPEDLGETPESLTQGHIVFQPGGLPPGNAPDLNDAVQTVLGYDGRADFFTSVEKSSLKDRLTQRAQAIKSVAPTVHLNKTQFEPIEGGLAARTYIGLAGGGFSSIKKARSVQKELRDEFNPDLVVRDGRTNEIKPLDEVPKEDRIGEYYLRFDEQLKYSADLSEAINAIRIDGTTGMIAKFLTKSSFLVDWAARAGSAAGSAKAAKKRILSEKLAPMNRLKTADRRLVEDVIDRGDQAGKWFSEDELLLEWGGRSNFRELYDGYLSFVDFQQTSWRLVNDGIREALDAANMKWITLPGLKRDQMSFEGDLLGEIVDTAPRDIQRVFDPSRNVVREITPEEVARLSETGRGFIKARRPYDVGGEEVEYILNTGTGVQIRKLPDQVIKNIPGRVPRLYDVSHIVKMRVKKIVNGRPVDGLIPVRMARNPSDAQRMADELELSDPAFDVTTIDTAKRKFVVRRADESREDIEYAERLSADYAEDSGQLWISERGIELDGIDGQRAVKPIQERLDAMLNKASSIGTLEPLIDKMRRNWELEFGEEFGDSFGRMPTFAKVQSRDPGRAFEGRRLRDAVAMRDYIRLLEGTDPGLLQRNIKNAAVYVSERLATPVAHSVRQKAQRAASGMIIAARDLDPINWAKQAAFLQFIVGNPIRQLALQAQQASVYLSEDFALKYFLRGDGVRDFTGILAGLSSRENPELFARVAGAWSNVLKSPTGGKMSVEEYTEFVDALRKSGLIANIDSHAFSAGMLTDKTFGGSGGFISNVGFDAFNGAIRAAKAVRKVGFDAGETINRVNAFLAARNRWINENPNLASQWAKGDNLGKIAGRAEQVAFEMTREGTLAFQKGLLGLIFQFASHNTKAMQSLIPNTRILGLGKLSNKAFTNKQKRTLALTQLGIYGVEGFGLMEIYEQLKGLSETDLPDEVDTAIGQGLFGSLVKAIVQGATEEPFDVDVTGNIAPFSGVSDVPLFRVMADAQSLGIFDFSNIPAGSTAADVKDRIETIGFLVGKVDFEEAGLEDSSKSLLVLDQIASLLPIYNKGMKARAELAINKILTETGDERVHASAAEILAKEVFGLQPTAQRQAFELKREFKGQQRGGFASDPLNQDLRDHAQRIYDMTKRMLTRTGDAEVDTVELNRVLRSVAQADKVILDDFDYRLVHQQFIPQIMYSDLRRGTDDAEIIRMIESTLKSGGIQTHDALLNRAGQSDLLEREHPQIAKFLREIGE